MSCLGHGHPRVIEAMARQASKVAYAHTGFFTSEPAEALADLDAHDSAQGYGALQCVSATHGSDGTLWTNEP